MATNLESMENLESSENLKIDKMSEKARNYNFCGKTWKTQGKCKTCDIIVHEHVFQLIFSLKLFREKFKMPWKFQGNSGNLATLFKICRNTKSQWIFKNSKCIKASIKF